MFEGFCPDRRMKSETAFALRRVDSFGENVLPKGVAPTEIATGRDCGLAGNVDDTVVEETGIGDCSVLMGLENACGQPNEIESFVLSDALICRTSHDARSLSAAPIT